MPVTPAAEAILEPDLPIIDPHHHLWRMPAALLAGEPRHGMERLIRKVPVYLREELLADARGGHNILGTVFMECGSMYREAGPPELRPVGETEFVTSVAEAGTSGEPRLCAGIVGHADLSLGAAVGAVLQAHIEAGKRRFRGVRDIAAWDADPAVLGPLAHVREGLLADPGFREGFACLAPMDLSFDAWLLAPQLPELVDLARAFPETSIVLDHVGTPVGLGCYAGSREARFAGWKAHIEALGALPNVTVKLGGLAMMFCGFETFMADPPASSERLARDWRPYIETCIEAFGPERCMFESNFPVDRGTCDYATLWNAFKRLASGYSPAEKEALFSGTARRVYRLEI
jgi:predicted TIM-barrel fold metal-dependent hydrolase